MRLHLNGQPQEFSDSLTVAALLTTLALTGRLAVEVNGDIVPRGKFPTHQLHDGDRIEIVRAIGGG